MKRYAPTPHGMDCLVEDFQGVYVTYADHAAALAAKDAEVAHYKTRLESLTETYGKSCEVAAAAARREALEKVICRLESLERDFHDAAYQGMSRVVVSSDFLAARDRTREQIDAIRALIDAAPSTGKEQAALRKAGSKQQKARKAK